MTICIKRECLQSPLSLFYFLFLCSIPHQLLSTTNTLCPVEKESIASFSEVCFVPSPYSPPLMPLPSLNLCLLPLASWLPSWPCLCPFLFNLHHPWFQNPNVIMSEYCLIPFCKDKILTEEKSSRIWPYLKLQTCFTVLQALYPLSAVEYFRTSTWVVYIRSFGLACALIPSITACWKPF